MYCMTYRLVIITFAISITLTSCYTYKSIPDLKGEYVVGAIYNGETQEALIGQKISEFNYLMNSSLTDTDGLFEIQFQAEHPIIVIHGYYEPLYVEIDPYEFNLIVINPQLEKKSRRLIKKLNSYFGKQIKQID